MAHIANHQTGPTRRLTLALGLASITACRPVNLRATLADQIAEDFATGRVVTLAGWQLAHTEAWLCAAIHAQSS